MSDALNKCSANETAACCCVDVVIFIDYSYCTSSWSRVFSDRQQAEAMLATLTEKAHGVESEPCVITPRFTDVAEGVQLDVDFTFSCQAETLIFQLGLR